MWETDDRLVGDPVWELFPSTVPEDRKRSLWPRLAVAAIVTVLGVWLCHPLAVVAVCVAVAWGDFVRGWRSRRSIPDPCAARVSARFSYGWAFWKVGMTGFALMSAVVLTEFPRGGQMTLPPADFIAASLLWMGGFVASAFVTATGLLAAIRSGMRVWVGQAKEVKVRTQSGRAIRSGMRFWVGPGVNQARTLLLSMLVVGFTAGVLMPLMFVFVMGVHTPHSRPDDGLEAGVFLSMFAGLAFGGDLQQKGVFGVVLLSSMFVAPVVLLLILDAVSKRVIADQPTKFGPKIAAVGKWSKPDPVKRVRSFYCS
jgi:hypothetical protein